MLWRSNRGDTRGYQGIPGDTRGYQADTRGYQGPGDIRGYRRIPEGRIPGLPTVHGPGEICNDHLRIGVGLKEDLIINKRG